MKRNSQTFLWRGALGGAVGGFLWVWLLPAFARQDAYTQYARFLVIFFVVPFSTVIGMIVGWVVAGLHARTKKNYGVLMRVVIGVACSAAASLITWAAVNMIRTSERPIVWSTEYWLLFGIMVGVFAGCVIGNQSSAQ